MVHACPVQSRSLRPAGRDGTLTGILSAELTLGAHHSNSIILCFLTAAGRLDRLIAADRTSAALPSAPGRLPSTTDHFANARQLIETCRGCPRAPHTNVLGGALQGHARWHPHPSHQQRPRLRVRPAQVRGERWRLALVGWRGAATSTAASWSGPDSARLPALPPCSLKNKSFSRGDLSTFGAEREVRQPRERRLLCRLPPLPPCRVACLGRLPLSQPLQLPATPP